MVSDACRNLGRSEDETWKFLKIAENEWLGTPASFLALDDQGWKRLGFPLGLRSEIVRLAGGRPQSSIASSREEPRVSEQRRSSKRYSLANPTNETTAEVLGMMRAVHQPEDVQESRSFHAPRRSSVFAKDSGVMRNVRTSRNMESEKWSTEEHHYPSHDLGWVRNQLLKRGAGDLIGIARQFRILDKDDNGRIDRNEFKEITKLLGSDQWDESLFEQFDTDGSNSISYEEFIRALRGSMNRKRAIVVMDVFTSIDKDNDGFITKDEIIEHFQDFKHGGFKVGQFDARNAKNDFIRVCDTDKDGRISQQEWRIYYETVSSGIDEDNLFITMVRNSWKMPGSDRVLAADFRRTNLHKERAF